MNWLSAILLAVIAGITEMIPVSGTAHLFLFEKLLGLPSASADQQAYRGMLYFGAALALLLFYRSAFFAMVREFFVLIGVFRPRGRQRGVPFSRRLQFLTVMGSMPMALGLLLLGPVERMEAGEYLLLASGLFLCLNGAVLFFVGRSHRGRRSLQEIRLSDAVFVGAAQLSSVFPGLSRCGVTLTAALAREFDTPAALELSGLMGIPVFLSAGIRQMMRSGGPKQAISLWLLLAGMFLSAAVGICTLRLLSEQLSRRRPTGFAYWCWGAGILSLILFLVSA